ncbi:MAG: GerMN domain-containing protein [Gaiellales bacterium]
MTNELRVMRVSATLAVGLALALALVGSETAGATTTTKIWFLQKGEPVAVQRTVAGAPGAIKALLAGPTPVERAKGITTAIPANTKVLRVELRRRVVTVDLVGRFAMGFNGVSLTNRVGQLVRTMRSLPGVLAVKLRIEGGVPVGLFPGYDLARPVAEPYAPEAPAPPTLRETQQLLADLGFMARSGVTGSLDGQTSNAVLAFEKWARLDRDGVLSDEVTAAIARSTRPQPALHKPGHRIEVHLGRQLALLIDGNRVTRLVHISSGAYGKTPRGSFHVYRKERYSWSVPFKVWLPYASYIVGGVAFHEFGSVPTYAASHGCIRVNHYDAPMLYEFATYGTPVDVIWEPGA